MKAAEISSSDETTLQYQIDCLRTKLNTYFPSIELTDFSVLTAAPLDPNHPDYPAQLIQLAIYLLNSFDELINLPFTDFWSRLKHAFSAISLILTMLKCFETLGTDKLPVVRQDTFQISEIFLGILNLAEAELQKEDNAANVAAVLESRLCPSVFKHYRNMLPVNIKTLMRAMTPEPLISHQDERSLMTEESDSAERSTLAIPLSTHLKRQAAEHIRGMGIRDDQLIAPWLEDLKSTNTLGISTFFQKDAQKYLAALDFHHASPEDLAELRAHDDAIRSIYDDVVQEKESILEDYRKSIQDTEGEREVSLRNLSSAYPKIQKKLQKKQEHLKQTLERITTLTSNVSSPLNDLVDAVKDIQSDLNFTQTQKEFFSTLEQRVNPPFWRTLKERPEITPEESNDLRQSINNLLTLKARDISTAIEMKIEDFLNPIDLTNGFVASLFGICCKEATHLYHRYFELSQQYYGLQLESLSYQLKGQLTEKLYEQEERRAQSTGDLSSDLQLLREHSESLATLNQWLSEERQHTAGVYSRYQYYSTRVSPDSHSTILALENLGEFHELEQSAEVLLAKEKLLSGLDQLTRVSDYLCKQLDTKTLSIAERIELNQQVKAQLEIFETSEVRELLNTAAEQWPQEVNHIKSCQTTLNQGLISNFLETIFQEHFGSPVNKMGGLFGDYLQQRAQTFWFRDRSPWAFFERCQYGTTEKLRRETYLQELRTLFAECHQQETLDEDTFTCLHDKIQSGLKSFHHSQGLLNARLQYLAASLSELRDHQSTTAPHLEESSSTQTFGTLSSS